MRTSYGSGMIREATAALIAALLYVDRGMPKATADLHHVDPCIDQVRGMSVPVAHGTSPVARYSLPRPPIPSRSLSAIEARHLRRGKSRALSSSFPNPNATLLAT